MTFILTEEILKPIDKEIANLEKSINIFERNLRHVEETLIVLEDEKFDANCAVEKTRISEKITRMKRANDETVALFSDKKKYMKRLTDLRDKFSVGRIPNTLSVEETVEKILESLRE